MKSRINAALDKYLPYTDDGPEWSLMFEDKDGVTAFERNGTMIKSVATLDHHPKQIFNLVADIKRRREYEKNVRYDERVKRCNSHTFIDYYAYQPVWPTTAREFLVLFHWRVVKSQDNKKAIVLIGFSYPEGNSLRPPTDDHVRADLEVSLFLLELCGENKTKATRIISYDLCGNIPRSLTNSIMQQQATMPHIISIFLKCNEPIPHSQLSEGDITDTILAVEIIDRLPDDADGLDCVRRRLLFDSSVSSTVDDEEPSGVPVPEPEKKLGEDEDLSKPSALLVALILMTPLVLYNLIDSPKKELAFMVSAFVAVRVVVLLYLGTPLPEHDYTGIVTCRLSVNLRGFLSFLAKRRDDGVSRDGPEPSVVPLVMKAVGKALAETDGMNCKYASIPLLGVSGCFFRQDVAVSVFGTSNSAKERVITISGVDNMAIDSIASEIEKRSEKRAWESSSVWVKAMHIVRSSLGLNQEETLGSCLVVTSPDSEGYDIDIGVAPFPKFNAVILVGGVRMSKQPWPKSLASPAHRMKPSPPLLAVTISVQCPACSVAECRRFAERVQELIELADM
ncbi:2-oxoacid dehydrogenases acyltransferase [Fragilaria crotonensis]|nr:2-oxoacid dehydrogenases acyltransferase [Fragilaria crotonensis]